MYIAQLQSQNPAGSTFAIAGAGEVQVWLAWDEKGKWMKRDPCASVCMNVCDISQFRILYCVESYVYCIRMH